MGTALKDRVGRYKDPKKGTEEDAESKAAEAAAQESKKEVGGAVDEENTMRREAGVPERSGHESPPDSAHQPPNALPAPKGP